MPSYTWLQAIRILAGREAGDQYLPDTTPPIPECEPPRVKELLADGIAVVEGIPRDGDLHEPIPAIAWWRIRIEFLRSDSKDRLFETVAKVPGKHVPDLTASRMWSDLRISADGLAALQAAAQRFARAATMPLERSSLNEAPIEPGNVQAPAAVLVRTLVAVDDGAEQIAAVNPPRAAAYILARLLRAIERGSLKAPSLGVVDGKQCALAPDLAGWCCCRDFICPLEWGPLPPTEDDCVPLDEGTSAYVPMCDAVHWIAYYADDPAECIAWAANKELLPKLEAAELTAVGRKDRTGDYVEIPSTAFIDVELFPLDPEGGHILPKNHGARGARWDRIRLWKDDVLRLWPSATRPLDKRVLSPRYRTGLPGQPSSIHLVEAELDRRVAAGAKWPTKALCAVELAGWLKFAHPEAARATPKTIQNRLGARMQVTRK